MKSIGFNIINVLPMTRQIELLKELRSRINNFQYKDEVLINQEPPKEPK